MRKINIIKKSGKCGKSLAKIYFVVFLFFSIILGLILYKTYTKEEKYLVNEGKIEYTSSCIAYVIKNETIVDVDSTKILIPTVSEGSRVSKNNIIATYREAEYQDYQEKLKKIDEDILKAMKDINVEYSVDVKNLEEQVVKSIVSAQNTTSMIEMQEYKTNINNLLSKRANIIGKLSPEDAYVKSLIADREKLENQLKTSSSNIKAPIGGIISYTVDGIEDKLTEDTIMKLNYEDVKEYVSNRKETASNKIRITSNYEAYLMVRVDNVDKEYIKEGNTYTLKIVGVEENILNGQIVKVTETEQGYEVIFRVTNGIENIVDSRECEVEVVWTSYEGLIVPVKAITRKKDGKDYVKIITRGEYVDIPVKVEQKNKTYAVVSNYERENLNSYILERYDQVVISTN